MDCSTPGFPILHYLQEFTQTHVHWVDDATQPSHLLSHPSLALSLSQDQDLFQWVDSSHHVAKVLELHLQHQSFQWIFRVDFLWIDWFDLLVAQETLKNLLHQHNSKTWILWHSTFFMVQLSHPYMTTRKTIALIIQASVCKVMSLIWLRANHRKRRWQRRLIEVVRKRGGKAELSSVMEIRETATQEGGGSSQCSWDAKRKTGCQIAAGWELKEWSILSSLTIKKF